MLSNSLVAGMLAAGYVVVLVLQLNPSLPLSPVRLMPLVTTVGVFYAVHLTVIFYIVLVVRQLLAAEVFSPAWLSIGVLVWLGWPWMGLLVAFLVAAKKAQRGYRRLTTLGSARWADERDVKDMIHAKSGIILGRLL